MTPMKKILMTLIATFLVAQLGTGASAPAKSIPRYKARVVCFNGKIDSGSSCAGTNFQPDGPLHSTGKMTCGLPGKVSEIEWTFVAQRGDKDVYKFTRRFPTDTTAPTISSKTVEFRGSRVIVFEDPSQVVVIDPPQK